MPYCRASTSAVSPMIMPRQRAREAVAVHRVDEREVAHRVPPSRVLGVDEIRHAAHRLDAAGHDDLGFAEQDRLRAAGDRLHARGARLVDRLRRHRIRQAGAPARPAAPDSDPIPPAVRGRSALPRRAPGSTPARASAARDRDRAELGRMHVSGMLRRNGRWAFAPRRRSRPRGGISFQLYQSPNP